MAGTNDTIDGLLAEFRGYSAGMPASYHVTMSWHDFRVMLDRLEAAWKRDCAKIEADALVVGGIVEAAHKREAGDASKLREALEFIKQYFDKIDPFNINTYTFSQIEVEHINESITAALSAPPRNCDRPECATTKTAQELWRREDGGKTAYYEWLLATATKGGAPCK